MTALQYQIASAPGATDYAFYNYGSSDIPAYVAVSVDATNVVDMAANEGVGVVVVAADGNAVIGVTMEIIKSHAAGRVRCCGPIAQMTADGTITANGWVMATSDALKVGFAKAQTSAKGTLGLALTTAADGDPVAIMITTAPNA